MKTPLLEKLYRWNIHHVALWVGYYSFWVIMYRDFYDDVTPLFVSTGLYSVFNAIPFYIIDYWLVKKFLPARRFVLFGVLAILTITISSLCLSGALYLLFRHVPEVQANIRFLFIGSFSSTVLVVSLLSLVKLLFHRVRTERQAERVEKQRLETELEYLKAQVNPHFLFNAINSVYVLIRKDPDKAAETLIKLSDLLRFQLYDCSDDYITIEMELEYLTNYMNLEKLRKGDKVKVSFNLNGEFSGFRIAPFMLIPFLENAFKYVSAVNGESKIEIDFVRQGDQLTASFLNTFDGQPHYAVGGIGLKNVKRRLDLLYPGKHELSIEQPEGAYRATLTLHIA